MAGCQVAFVHNVQLDHHLPETPVRAMAAVDGLALSGERLAQLVVDLRAWLGQSLGALAADPLEYSIDLPRGPAESLSLTLGSRHDVITTVGGVACSVELRSNALSATVPLATDPRACNSRRRRRTPTHDDRDLSAAKRGGCCITLSAESWGRLAKPALRGGGDRPAPAGRGALDR